MTTIGMDCVIVELYRRIILRGINGHLMVIFLFLHFHCDSLIESLHMICPSFLHEQINLSHGHIFTIWADQRQHHPISLFA